MLIIIRRVGHDVTTRMVFHNLIEFQQQLHDEKPNIPTTYTIVDTEEDFIDY